MVAKKKIPWPQIFDGKRFEAKLFQLYNVRSTPTHYLVDRDGNIVAKDIRKKELKKLIAEALEQ